MTTMQTPSGKTRYVLPIWIRDIMVGVITVGMAASIGLVLRLDKTVAAHISTQAEAHKAIEQMCRELQVFATETREMLVGMNIQFTEFRASTSSKQYTVQQAYEDQRSQAEELKKLWEQIHALQIDVTRLQSAERIDENHGG